MGRKQTKNFFKKKISQQFDYFKNSLNFLRDCAVGIQEFIDLEFIFKFLLEAKNQFVDSEVLKGSKNDLFFTFKSSISNIIFTYLKYHESHLTK